MKSTTKKNKLQTKIAKGRKEMVARYQAQRLYWETRLGAEFNEKKFHQDFAHGMLRGAAEVN